VHVTTCLIPLRQDFYPDGQLPVISFLLLENRTLNIHKKNRQINPLNAELNPICHLLALLGAHHILHVSRVRINILSKIFLNCSQNHKKSAKNLLPEKIKIEGVLITKWVACGITTMSYRSERSEENMVLLVEPNQGRSINKNYLLYFFLSFSSSSSSSSSSSYSYSVSFFSSFSSSSSVSSPSYIALQSNINLRLPNEIFPFISVS
jgi:hypothetical protein